MFAFGTKFALQSNYSVKKTKAASNYREVISKPYNLSVSERLRITVSNTMSLNDRK